MLTSDENKILNFTLTYLSLLTENNLSLRHSNFEDMRVLSTSRILWGRFLQVFDLEKNTCVCRVLTLTLSQRQIQPGR